MTKSVEMILVARKMVDCRKVPSEINCTLTIAGTEDELLEAAVQHAVTRHGDEDTPELRQMIRSAMEDVEPALA
jgi:predicted small metal-binding protein